MKLLIERLSSGNPTYDTPDVFISENKISAELKEGENLEGSFEIVSNVDAKGVVYSTSPNVTFENNSFYGKQNSIKYRLSAEGILPGEYLSANIYVVTSGGDFTIPVLITGKKSIIETNSFDVETMDDFLKLVRESYDEALVVFLSKQFKEVILKDDLKAVTLYNAVLRNGRKRLALEEFLIGMGLKERIQVSLKQNLKEYMDVVDNYGDVLRIEKSSWGYVRFDVKVEGDFIINYKDTVESDDFNGNIAEFSYLISYARLHGGENRARITFTSSMEVLTADIVVINRKEGNLRYIKEKQNRHAIMKNYISFRRGKIDGDEWKANMQRLSQERLLLDENDHIGLLMKAQIAILNGSPNAIECINEAGAHILPVKNEELDEYCYFQYLSSLYRNDPEHTKEVENEIKSFYDMGHDLWQILWILFYMDDRYKENPSLKYAIIKRSFNNGALSPAIMYEAAMVLVNNPELLRILNRFEVAVLDFVIKNHIAGKELAKKASDLISKSREVNRHYLRILKGLYDDTDNKEVLTSLCSMAIALGLSDNSMFRYYSDAVKYELSINGLYEHYLYSAPKDEYFKMDKSIYRYFSYGTDSLNYCEDYFYANAIENLDENSETYKRVRAGLESFVTKSVLAGDFNRHLEKIYKKVITKEFIVDELKEQIPAIFAMKEIEASNENIDYIIVIHKETFHMERAKVQNGFAYVPIYTKDPVIIAVDRSGLMLSMGRAKVRSPHFDEELTGGFLDEGELLRQSEKIMEDPLHSRGCADTLMKAYEIHGVTREYQKKLRSFIIDYFYTGLDDGKLDLYPARFNMESLSVRDRRKVIELLVRDGLFEDAYTDILRYGFHYIAKECIFKVSEQMSKAKMEERKGMLLLLCADAFRKGCRDENVIRYLGKYYESGSEELYSLFEAARSKDYFENELNERILVQYIFESNSSERLYNIFSEYVRGVTSSKVRNAFYVYVSYNYFIKHMDAMDVAWEILEEELATGHTKPIICYIAYLDILSKRGDISNVQGMIAGRLIKELSNIGIVFDFFKKFEKWFRVSSELLDKTVIDYRTNPKHRVRISYEILTPEGLLKKREEDMKSIYSGIFTKSIILFYAERIDYSITEYSEEFPEGKVVRSMSLRMGRKDIYNDESRFGMINSAMICRELGEKDAAKDVAKTYELRLRATEDLFKLL